MEIEFIDLIQSCLLSNSTCVTHILCCQRIKICYLLYTFDPHILKGTFVLRKMLVAEIIEMVKPKQRFYIFSCIETKSTSIIRLTAMLQLYKTNKT